MSEQTSDLSELFARDPFKCSDQDIAAIITALRARRAAFKLDATSGAGKIKPPTAKQLQLKQLVGMKDIDI